MNRRSVWQGPLQEGIFTKADGRVYADAITLLKNEDDHFGKFIENVDLKEADYETGGSEFRQAGDADNDDERSAEDRDSVEAGANKSTRRRGHQTTSKHATKESHKEKMKVSKKWEILQMNNVNEEDTVRRLKYYE